MAKGSKRNKEKAAAQANKKRRVEKRNNPAPKAAAAPKASATARSSNSSQSRPSGNQSGLTTSEIQAKRKLKGIGQFADDKGKGKGKGKGQDKGKGQGKGSTLGTDKIPQAVAGANPNQRDQKIFNRLLDKDGELTKKIQQYQSYYSGDTKESREYLDNLRKDATKRMKINPRAYGRSKDKTAYENLSMAEQYDKNSDRLISSLEKPLTSYIDNPGDTKGLNMFDSNRELKFDSAKLRKFASSPRIGSTVRGKAEDLGVSYSGSNRVSKSLEGIGKVKNKKSSDLKSKFAQDLKFIV